MRVMLNQQECLELSHLMLTIHEDTSLASRDDQAISLTNKVDIGYSEVHAFAFMKSELTLLYPMIKFHKLNLVSTSHAYSVM